MDNTTIYYQYMYSYPHKKAYYDIEEYKVLNAIKNLKDKELTVYIHVPFCSSKCGYCNLFSIPTYKESVLIEDYVNSVCRHIIQYGERINSKDVKVSTLVIGGGTPLILSILQMEKIFRTLEENLPIDIYNTNFVIETSPNETSLEKLEYLKSKGVKRISIGVQSFVQDELDNLYRKHSVKSSKEALQKLSSLNFESLNIDLIYGIKNQTMESLTYSIEQAISYNPQEVFIYPLYVREGTTLFNKMQVHGELQHRMYAHAVEQLISRGYFQTSMRRFVKKVPKENYSCGFEQMISVGCGGRSYIGNLHFCEPYKTGTNQCLGVLKDYIEKQDFMKDLKGYELNEDESKRRFTIKNLGYYEGIDLMEYEEYFNKNFISDFPLTKKFMEQGFIIKTQKRLKLTEKGRGYSDNILAHWISKEVKERMSI